MGEYMLTTKQRASLRMLANNLPDSVIIGKSGLTDTVVNEIEVALYHKELVKISVLKNCDADVRQMAFDAAEKLGAESVQIIGGKFVLYKFSEKEGIEHIKY